jgi:hypothetical protein
MFVYSTRLLSMATRARVRLSTIGDARCCAAGSFICTDAGLRVSYVWDSRHVTEPSERVGPRPSAIGYVAKGWIAAF